MTMFSCIPHHRAAVVYVFPVIALLGIHVLSPAQALAQRCLSCSRATVQNRCSCCPTYGPVPLSSPPYAAFPDDAAVDATPSLTTPDSLSTRPEDLSGVDSPIQDFADAPSLTAGQLASAFGGGAGAPGVPGMIGDFFGNNYSYAFITAGTNRHGGTTVAAGGGDRQFKFAENNSPFPRDRLFYNYHHFHNAVQDIEGLDRNVNRNVFGVEKTFCNGWGSFELRVPFANTVSSSPIEGVQDSLTGTEFGNLAMAVKALALRGECSALSVGLGIVVPTGDDYQAEGDFITNIFRNESVHLQPFLGIYHAPTSRLFTQFFWQFNFAANGSDVTLDQTTASLRTQSLMMLDYSMGYWLVRNRCARYVRGIAPLIEWHYTTTLEDQDYGPFRSGGLFIINDRRDVLNITGGLFLQLGDMSSLKVGAVAPLRTGDDKLFDSEVGLQFVRRF